MTDETNQTSLSRQAQIEALRRLVSVCKAPPLYHYASDDALMKIVETKALLAQRAVDFRLRDNGDAEEYVFGIKVVLDEIKKNKTLIETQVAGENPPNHRVLSEVGYANVIDALIAHLEYELVNDLKPKFEVLIACLTTDPESDYMLANYGRQVIGFDPIIQALAYSTPEPFSRSMLSAVAYDQQILRNVAVSIGFGQDLASESISAHLDQLSADQKVSTISVWIAEELCSLAANIKEEKWKREREWRLKSIRSHHGVLSRSFLEKATPFKFFQMPAIATFIDQERRRYLHSLAIFGKFPISVIGLHPPIKSDVGKALDKFLPRTEPRMGLDGILKIIELLEGTPREGLQNPSRGP